MNRWIAGIECRGLANEIRSGRGRGRRFGVKASDGKKTLWVLVSLALVMVDVRSVVGQTERKPFVMDTLHISEDLEAEYFRYETQTRRSARTVIAKSVFRQILHVALGGYSFDPRLLRWQLKVDLGNEFLSGKFDTPFQSNIPRKVSTLATRLNYDLVIQLFPQSRESLSLWTRRRDYSLNELLFDTFAIEETAYGARFDTRWPVAPFSLSFERRDVVERGLFETTHEVSDDLLFQLRKELSERSRLDIDYEYLWRRRVTVGERGNQLRTDLVEDTDRADAFYEYRFGPLLRSNAITWLSYLNQRGSFPFANQLARERLNLFHTPTFQTDYGVTYQHTDIGLRKINTGEMALGLRHRLFENFVTRLATRVRHTDEATVSWDELELLGNWSYWRHTPWGRLLINYMIQNVQRTSNDPANENNVRTNYFEIAHEFKYPVRLFYRLEDQRLTVSVPTQFAITNSTAHTIGYEIPWRQWAWLQRFRRLDDTLGRTDVFSSELRGIIRLPNQSTLNLRLGQESTSYYGRIQDSQDFIGGVGYFLPFGRTGVFDAELLKNDRFGLLDEREWRARSSLHWRWRKLKVDFSGQYGLFENRRSATTREGTHLLLTISREFR